MIVKTYTGKHARATVFASGVEDTALEQIKAIIHHPAFAGSTIVIMPDVHAGAGCVIGLTATLTDKVIPNIIGVDIGCGVSAWRLPFLTKENITDTFFESFDKHVREWMPSGRNTRPAPMLNGVISQDLNHYVDKMSMYLGHTYSEDDEFWSPIKDICERTGQKLAYVMLSLGTLGGGNHFVEIALDEHDVPWLLIHSGSRNFGKRIADYHQHKAVEKVGKMNGLEYLDGDDMQQYIADMKVAQVYASHNRLAIGNALLSFFGLFPKWVIDNRVESVHNYIDFDGPESPIIRKGAVSAYEGRPVIVPMNMAFGTFFGYGRGNKDYNYSAPHGAGRTMGRNQAKKILSLTEFEERMKDAHVWSSCISGETLDESPMAYKPAEEIKEYLNDTLRDIIHMKPVYNFKASE